MPLNEPIQLKKYTQIVPLKVAVCLLEHEAGGGRKPDSVLCCADTGLPSLLSNYLNQLLFPVISYCFKCTKQV